MVGKSTLEQSKFSARRFFSLNVNIHDVFSGRIAFVRKKSGVMRNMCHEYGTWWENLWSVNYPICREFSMGRFIAQYNVKTQSYQGVTYGLSQKILRMTLWYVRYDNHRKAKRKARMCLRGL